MRSPGCTVYTNTSVSVLLPPPRNVAGWSVLPVSIRTVGAASPAAWTVTFSLNCTRRWIADSVPYQPVVFANSTESTLGATPSTAMSARSPSVLPPPQAGRIRRASFPAASLIFPPFSCRAVLPV